LTEDRGHRFAVELNEAGGDQFSLFSAPYVRKAAAAVLAPASDASCGALADRLAIENAAVEIDKRPRLFRAGGCRRNRARSSAGIEADQNKPSDVTQRPPFGGYQTSSAIESG
jgi:hypothetical protein